MDLDQVYVRLYAIRCRSGFAVSQQQRLNTFLLMSDGVLDRCSTRDRDEAERAMLWLARDLKLLDDEAVDRFETAAKRRRARDSQAVWTPSHSVAPDRYAELIG